MRCPHCGSNWMPKDGRSRGKRTYRCGDCKYRCVPDGSHHYYSSEVVDRALAMYAEGASVESIGRAMEIKEGTILRWVKKSPFVRLDNGRGAFGAQASRGGSSSVGEEGAWDKLGQARSEDGFVR